MPHEAAALTLEKVIAFCEGQIAHFKVPQHVRIVDELPMTVTGKPSEVRHAGVDGEGGACGGGEPKV